MNNLIFIFIAFFGVFILSSLFSLVVATRRWHWFLKATIIVASVLPLAVVEANDLVLILLVSELSILTLFCYERFRIDTVSSLDDDQGHRLFVRPRFSLHDLLLVIVVACCVLAVLSQLVRSSQFLEINHQVGIGIALAVWSLLGVGIFYWRLAWIRKLPLLLVAGIGSLLWSSLDDQWLVNGVGQVQRVGIWALFLSFISATVLLMTFLYRFGLSRNPADTAAKPTIQFARRGALVIMSTMVIFMGGMVCYFFAQLLIPPPAARNYLPLYPEDKDAFPSIVEAGSRFEASQILSSTLAVEPGEQMRKEIQLYSEAFAQVESALERKSLFWIDWTNGDWHKNQPQNLNQPNGFDFQKIRSVARALTIRSRQSLHDGDDDNALEDGLRIMRISQPATADGILLTSMIGNACESIGRFRSLAALKEASKPKLIQSATFLDEFEPLVADVDRIMVNESWYIWQTNSWRQRLYLPVMREQTMEPVLAMMEDRIRSRRAEQAQLRVSIALEIFRRDHDAYPKDLGQLVDKYITNIPLDPFSPIQGPLRYVRTEDGNGYSLYSVGKNGTDEKGVVDAKGDPNKGDLNLAEMAKNFEETFRARASAANANGGQ